MEMTQDTTHAINDAEKTIQGRRAIRDGTSLEFRSPVALEMIADELTRLHAEARTIRYLLATIAAREARR